MGNINSCNLNVDVCFLPVPAKGIHHTRAYRVAHMYVGRIESLYSQMISVDTICKTIC